MESLCDASSCVGGRKQVHNFTFYTFNFTFFGIEANVLRVQIRTNASQPDWVSPLTANVHGVGGRAGKSAFGGATVGEERKTLEKWAFRGACPSSFRESTQRK